LFSAVPSCHACNHGRLITCCSCPAAGLPPALAGLLALQDKARRREGLKQQMALASQQLLAEPEQHVGPGLRLLLRLAADEDGVVVRLALMSCLLVFKDLLPGYRIRPPSEAELQVGADWTPLPGVPS
jgi:nucleolar complex protein 3